MFPRAKSIKVKTSNTIEFQVLDWFSTDEIDDELSDSEDEDEEESDSDDEEMKKKKRKDKRRFLINMYGVTEKGRSVSVYVKGFPTFFYLEIPQTWKKYQATQFVEYLKDNAPASLKTMIRDYNIVYRKKFRGFTNNKKFSFLRLVFLSKSSMMYYLKQCNKPFSIPGLCKKTYIIPWESNIDPMIRFMHIRDIEAAGWISIAPKKFTVNNPKKTHCQIEVTCHWKDIVKVEKDMVAPIIQASFDIEADSSHGDFPLAKKDYRKLVNDIINYHTTENRKIRNINNTLGSNTNLSKDEKSSLKNEIKKIKDNLDKPNTLEDLIKLAFFSNGENDKDINHVYTKWNRIRNCEMKPKESVIKKVAEEIKEKEYLKTILYLKRMKQEHVDVKEIHILEVDETINQRIEKLQFKMIDLMGKNFPPIEGDKIIQIGTTVQIYGEPDCSIKHIITLNGCSPIENAIVESYDNEKDVIMAWTKFIRKLDPDVILGYNIFGFDIKYMYERAEELNTEEEFSKLSREKNLVSKLEEKQLSSSALGDNFFYIIPMKGRILIDLMKAIQGNPVYKLDSYSLDNVASTFMRGKIKGFEYNENNETILKTSGTKGLKKLNFITISVNDGIKVEKYQGGQKFKMIEVNDDSIVLADKIQLDDISKIQYSWCENKDDVSAKDIFRLQKGDDDDRCTVARYCIQDCELCNRIMNKLDILTNSIGMGNVCTVPISYLFLRGQGVKIYSLVSKQCRLEDFLLPVLKKVDNPNDEEKEGYEGAIVLKAMSDIYYDPVVVSDYNSLYPSSMISDNLSHDTFVMDPQYDNLPGITYKDIVYDNYMYIKKGKGDTLTKVINEKEPVKTCRFVQYERDENGVPINETRGVIPRILQKLLKARKDTRNKIKNEPDQFKKQVLDGLQLAYKVTANSLYGQIGASTSPIYLKDIAASTTAVGRRCLVFARDYCMQNYEGCRAIYGDSVAYYTPVYLRVNNQVDICPIDDIAIKYGNNNWLFFKEPGKQGKQFCELENVETWSDKGWTKLERVIRHKIPKEKSVFRIVTHTGLVDVTDDHSLLLKNGKTISPKNIDVDVETELLHHNLPINNIGKEDENEVNNIIDEIEIDDIKADDTLIPNIIINGSSLLKEKYFNLFIKENGGWSNIKLKNQVKTAQLIYIGNCLGWKGSINTIGNKVYKITFSKEFKKNPNVIKKMNEIKYNGYVYDLTTCNHHFSSGMGKIVVHNTDSIFMAFECVYQDGPKKGQKMTGMDAIYESIRLCIEASAKISSQLDPPHNLEFEKCIYPFLLLSKKRYVGNYYTDYNEDFYTNSMGIVLKRRDNAPIVKHIYGGVVNILLKYHLSDEFKKILEKNPKMNIRTYMVKKAQNFVVSECKKLLEGKFTMDKFIISKSLRSEYKNEDSIAHKVLANRMGDRDPGNKPKSNDRIPYAYIVVDEKKGVKILQGDRIEHPDYIIQNKLKLDYKAYLVNQVQKPVSQIFGLAVELLDGYINGKFDFSKIEPMKKRNEKKSEYASKILFERIINEYMNRITGKREITDFFK